MPNSDGANTNNISFAFEVAPPFQYGDPLTYDIVLSWEEEERGILDHSETTTMEQGTTSQGHMYALNLRRNGQTYQFTISKSTLRSGPLYVSVTASLLCNDSIYNDFYPYCSTRCLLWQFKGQSDLLRIVTQHGMYDTVMDLSLYTCMHQWSRN